MPLFRAPAIPNTVDGVVFEAGNWEPHLAAGDEGDSWGNHRAVVVVDDPSANAVMATIPWRRRDQDPAAKSIVVLDAASGLAIQNALALRRETGATISELLRSALAMRANQKLTNAQMILAANAPILARIAMSDGDPVRGYLPSGTVAGMIGDRPSCQELISRIAQEAEETLKRLGA